MSIIIAVVSRNLIFSFVKLLRKTLTNLKKKFSFINLRIKNIKHRNI